MTRAPGSSDLLVQQRSCCSKRKRCKLDSSGAHNCGHLLHRVSRRIARSVPSACSWTGHTTFEEIARRPNTTSESLQAAMKVARWHDPGMAATLLPMSRISDTGRAQVAAYILSLRTQQ
jgi:hypothetical protein